MTRAQSALDALRGADRVVALTGAGISKDSGIPTFRDAQTGVWARFRPEDLATPDAFRRRPVIVWNWYATRRRMVAGAEPNAGHRLLARMQRHFPSFLLVTQNVDGLHQRAGSTDVVELHGNIARVRCSSCSREAADAPDHDVTDAPPACAACGGYLRPDVVWFGEMLPEDALQRAADEAAACDVFLSVGTSGVVFPAAGLISLAERAGATVIHVNPDPDAAPSGALRLDSLQPLELFNE